MNEEMWRACEDPEAMLEFLRGKASERKLRLFAVACCRLFWDSLNIGATRQSIEIIERYADNQATEAELSRAQKAAHNAAWYIRDYPHLKDDTAARLRCREALGIPTDETLSALYTDEVLSRLYFVGFMANTSARLRVDAVPMHRTDPLLVRFSPRFCRDILGDPFWRVTINATWRTSNVTGLAQAIYDDRAFDRLPILADALEDAGCDNADILNHCRQPGEHVRGCWVVDLLLKRS
jgi:hypothetical protein